MDNPNNLTQALDNLKHEAQREFIDVRKKEADLQKITSEKGNLEAFIREQEALIKQKEQEIQKIRLAIQQATTKITEADRASRKLAAEVKHDKDEQVKTNQQLRTVQAEYEEVLRKQKR